MRVAIAFLAGLAIGCAVTALVVKDRVRSNERQAYSQGYREGWGELSASLAKHFESRSPSRQETILDHISMKNISIHVVEHNGAKTLLIVD